MKPIGEYIDVEDFDREYGLEDLLPRSLAGELLEALDGGMAATVLDAGGRVYWQALDRDCDYGGMLQQGQDIPAGQPIRFADAGRHGMLFPLTHELETIGFLALEASPERIPAAELGRVGGLASRALNRILYLNYQKCMTAGLHGQVVSDSYGRLKRKAEQLACSEEKYRLLAENLEKEVARQTQEIQDAQLRMLYQEKMAAVGQLAAGMAHEINNPIGFVISNLNTLRTHTREMAALIGPSRKLVDLMTNASQDPASAVKVKQQLAAIGALVRTMDIDFTLEDTDNLIDETLDGAKRVQSIVQNLRDFTHPSIETAENVDINQCLDTTLAVLSSFQGDGIAVQRDYADLPPVMCRLREINQVFSNILKNALQAVDGSGEILVRTRQSGRMVTITVSDNGVGIDPANVNRVFEPFFTTREVGDGIGLGLTQAYNAIKASGGTIEVNSDSGIGSTFSVILPLAGNGQEGTQDRDAGQSTATKR